MDVRKPTPSRPRAFTLVELLVVMSIICLLIAISLPSLSKAKAKASQVTCSTKVRNLIFATNLYLNEWNTTFPVNGLIMPKAGVPQMYIPGGGNPNPPPFALQAANDHEKWRLEFGALWSYMGGNPPLPGYTVPLPLATLNMRKRYLCDADIGYPRGYTGGADGTNPTQPLYLDTVELGSSPHVLQKPQAMTVAYNGYWSYSVNSVTNCLGRFRDRFGIGELPWQDPLQMIRVKTPASFILFFEEDSNSLFNDEVVDPPAYNEGDWLTNRHNGGGNVGFLDQHVEFFNQTIFDMVPSAIKEPDGTPKQYVDHVTPMVSPITRMFFPDGGAFVAPLQQPVTGP